MLSIKGQGVCGGIAFGKLELLKKELKVIQRSHVEDPNAEFARFEAARDKAKEQLKALYDKALTEVGEENAMIFDIHQMMLDDLDYVESIQGIITGQKLNAETAVANTADTMADMFASMDDSYMQARAADVRDISERVISILTGASEGGIKSNEPVVIGAEDLAPSETVQLDKSKILAFVTEKGSSNSHTSILARTMNIPAVIGAKGLLDDANDGKEIIVDGFTGEIFIEPDEETAARLGEKKKKADEQKALLQTLKGVKPVTKDGHEIMLYANIGSMEDITAVYANDGMGIGLFRSEFIYLQKDSYPTEDEQFLIYKSVAEKMLGKRVIIRTLDIGADKQVDYFDMPKEENPAMGVRAIRICLNRPDVFKTQLRALYRASVYGKIAIMFPMISSVKEVRRIKEICKEVCDELKAEGIPYNEDIELGIMIEIPAAAICSDQLAKEVDFFSIGTNDLTQYTLAVDRQNMAAAEFCDIHHPAILRLIQMTVENSHKNGIWTGICGELAADLELTETFLAMGVDELSVSPGVLLPLKKKVLDTNVTEIKDKALEILE